MSSLKIIKVCARNSKLAIAQTISALERIKELLPAVKFETNWLTTSGDRDQTQDLKDCVANFFTDDLDSKVINGEFDCAIHSAKDLPEKIDPKLDWFWLPWREDPRDVLILNKKFELYNGNIVLKGSNANASYPGLRIGISSVRREEYCANRFPNAELLSIRGNIDGRLAQLDENKYDVLIMAAAGLNRLGLSNRIDEYISLNDLKPPAGQGYLAVTFRKDDSVFTEMRKLFTKQVVFAGAGSGDPNQAPLATIDSLKKCEVCLYDALSPVELLKYLPKEAESIYVGKRRGQHSKAQSQICELIELYAKRGKAVVRLKGGDPGIFGRLAEEIETMDNNKLSFKVIPATSSLSAATTGTGMLLTRRDISRGFTVLTPCRKQSDSFHALEESEQKKMPLVFFMGITKVHNIVEELLSNGYKPSTPCSLIFSAGTNDEEIFSSTLNDVPEIATGKHPGHGPGLFIVGDITDKQFLYKNHGIFSDEKILVTGSSIIQKKSADIIKSNGGMYLPLPTIYLHENRGVVDTIRKMAEFDWLVITSPTAVKILLKMVREYKIDLRSFPKIITCGPGTSAKFIEAGIYPDAEASNNYGVKGILETASKVLKPGEKVLRLASNLAGTELADAIAELGTDVVNAVLYNNIPCEYDVCPKFTTVFFASASAATSFINQFGEDALDGKIVVSIGEPTAKVLTATNYKANIITDVCTVNGAFNALKAYLVNVFILENK